MATPRILLSFDQAVLSTNSPDTLVLSRKVNNTYSTAFAVASLNPRDSSTSQLFSQNVFAWEDSFRVLVSHNHSGSASALSASITNAVDVRHGEAVKFSRNMLLPATKIPDFAELHGKEKGGILFTVADMPVACRVEVMQVVGGNKSARIYQSEEAGGMSRVADVEVSDTVCSFVLHLLPFEDLDGCMERLMINSSCYSGQREMFR